MGAGSDAGADIEGTIFSSCDSLRNLGGFSYV